jgi:hypothetical protein
MQMLFLCPFSKAAWFCSPWFIKTEILAATHRSIPDMIQAVLNLRHLQINLTSLYTFLWRLWKAWNDTLFCMKFCRPTQVSEAANTIIQATKLEAATSSEDHTLAQVAISDEATDAATQLQVAPCQPMTSFPGATIRDISNISGSIIFSDAAWSPGLDGRPVPTGLGIYMQIHDGRPCSPVSILAISPPASLAIQAEAFGLLLAVKLAEMLIIHQATFLTDNATLATAAATQDLLHAPGHRTIRPQLSDMAATTCFNDSKFFYISRSLKFRAHHQARLALKLQNRPLSFRCLGTGRGACLNAGVIAMSCMSQEHARPCKMLLDLGDGKNI